jgi:hypothetical protein
MTMQTDLQAAVDKALAASAKLHDIVHGDAQSTVETESGPVKTVSGTLIGLEDAAIAARDAALAAQAGVEAARALAEAARDAAAVAETGAETARDDAQTSALAAETARDTAASAAAVAGNAFTDIDQKVLNGQDQLQTAVDAALAEAQAIEVNTGTSAADAAASAGNAATSSAQAATSVVQAAAARDEAGVIAGGDWIASSVQYDNQGSGLAAATSQGALDELTINVGAVGVDALAAAGLASDLEDALLLDLNILV